MPEDPAAARRRLRRIPDELRKRSSQSCDLCRSKRCRCVPAPSGKGCVACEGQKVSCSYTLPRKTRFYGSLDDLSDKYKCLEAIVRGAFPNESVSSAADLMQLGKRMGYDMPDLSQKPESPAKLEELTNTLPSPEDGTPSSNGHASKPTSIYGQLSIVRTESISGLSDSSGSIEESLCLVRDASGREYYIGPSGSLQFLGQLRRLLSQREKVPNDITNATSTSKFTEDETAHALETDDEETEGGADPVRAQEPPDIPLGGPSPDSANPSIAKGFICQKFASIEELLVDLPPPSILEELLQSYFENVHDDFPLFHRGTFEEEYELHCVQRRRPIRRQGAAPMEPPECGWIGSLHMMLVFGSTSNAKIGGIDHIALRKHCISVCRKILPQLISKCTLTSVQALLLLSLFLHNNNERNAAWNLLGTAARISFALGLHRSNTATSFRPIEREIRKRVFCTLYSFEQFLASSLGRPSGLNDMDVQVTPPRGVLLGGGQDGDNDILTLSVKLQEILSKARLVPSVGFSSGANRNSAGLILDVLRSWKTEVAKHRGLDIPSITEKDDPEQWASSSAMEFDQLKGMLGWQHRTRIRASLLLHLQYRYIAILVTRSFLLRRIAGGEPNVASATTPPASEDEAPLADACVEHACQLSRIVLLLESFDLLNAISGLDIYYAYTAAMVLILRCLQKHPEGDSPQHGMDQQEWSVIYTLRSLVVRLREAVSRVDKSGTMRRLARIMSLFDESVHNENVRKSAPATTDSSSSTSHTTHDSPMLFAPTPLSNASAFEPHLQAQQYVLQQNGPGVAAPQPDIWSQSRLTTPEGMPDFNSLVGPYLDPSYGPEMLDWTDVETMFNNYGQPQ